MKIREKRIPWRKSEIKNRVPSNKGKEWTPTYGKGYNLDKKQHTIKPLLERMETRGILGETIMDIGSGSIKMYESEPVGTNPKERITSMGSGIFYPAKGKKIVRVDIGLPAPIRTKKGIVEIKADAENLRPETFSDKVRFVQAARHLGISPRSRKKPVDSVLMSAVLNYVDFRKAITEASRYLKRGGRIIIHNEPGRGFSKLFS